ncbi:hypothetical protein TRVL_01841 [Trypanosoma vivax]|nr:hypothetical protein TRVL_01841 [Trypanosoma vivax]
MRLLSSLPKGSLCRVTSHSHPIPCCALACRVPSTHSVSPLAGALFTLRTLFVSLCAICMSGLCVSAEGTPGPFIHLCAAVRQRCYRKRRPKTAAVAALDYTGASDRSAAAARRDIAVVVRGSRGANCGCLGRCDPAPSRHRRILVRDHPAASQRGTRGQRLALCPGLRR